MNKLNYKSCYKYYLSDKQNNNKNISFYLYKKLVSLYLKYFFSLVLEGFRVQLYEGLGYFHIIGRKSSKPAPDWKPTKELWKNNEVAKLEKRKIFYINSHSNFIKYKLFWITRNVKIRFISLFSFQLNKKNRKLISNYINKGKEYYIIK